MFIIVPGRHVSVLIESPSGPSKKTDPYLKCLKMRCGIPNASVLDETKHKMHVSFCSYCTIGIPISKTFFFRCVVIGLWILLYILLLITKFVHKC